MTVACTALEAICRSIFVELGLDLPAKEDASAGDSHQRFVKTLVGFARLNVPKDSVTVPAGGNTAERGFALDRLATYPQEREGMFKKWFEGKFSKTQLEEAQQFLRMLRGANESVIESIAAGTMFWAAIYETKGLELYDIAFWINDNPLFVMELHKQICGFQKRGQSQNAPGLMVWLHTARAASYPELKETARQIWAELARAPESAIELANSAAENAGIIAPLCYNRVPHDFEALGGGR